ncbi:hypothetical protein V6R21_18895 [Limibacter armeniacum]|uniref:hypothetical protein n=1 Tax=Limibacter armeniacum TaxID=466084 RepID=UPI002FE552B7
MNPYTQVLVVTAAFILLVKFEFYYDVKKGVIHINNLPRHLLLAPYLWLFAYLFVFESLLVGVVIVISLLSEVKGKLYSKYCDAASDVLRDLVMALFLLKHFHTLL